MPAPHQAQLLHKGGILYAWSLAHCLAQSKSDHWPLRWVSDVLSIGGRVQLHPREGPRASCMLKWCQGFTPTISHRKMHLVLYIHLISEKMWRNALTSSPSHCLDVRSINNVYFRITEPRHHQGLRTLDYLEALDIWGLFIGGHI